jgi:hypothetical protein
LVSTKVNLFAIYLGGKADGFNIEAHHTVFAVGETIEDCFDQCRKNWPGNTEGLHIDGYLILEIVDNNRVAINYFESIYNKVDKFLYFVYFGYSLPGQLIENHKEELIIASSMEEAKMKSKCISEKGILVEGLEKPCPAHVDNIIPVPGVVNNLRVELQSLLINTDNSVLSVSQYIKI